MECLANSVDVSRAADDRGATDAVQKRKAIEQKRRGEQAEIEVLHRRLSRRPVATAEEEQDVRGNGNQFQSQEEQHQLVGTRGQHRAADNEHQRPLKLRSQFHLPPAAGERENDAGQERNPPQAQAHRIDDKRAAERAFGIPRRAVAGQSDSSAGISDERGDELPPPCSECAEHEQNRGAEHQDDLGGQQRNGFGFNEHDLFF